jgi:hypothetical protein
MGSEAFAMSTFPTDSGRRCPHCDSRNTRPSRLATLLESLLGLLLVFPYRCRACSARFWRFL